MFWGGALERPVGSSPSRSRPGEFGAEEGAGVGCIILFDFEIGLWVTGQSQVSSFEILWRGCYINEIRLGTGQY